jgi:hypothetical protein
MKKSEKNLKLRKKSENSETRKIKKTTKKTPAEVTDSFINAVTKSNNPKETQKLFCKNGILIGTLSRITRRNMDKYNIEDYFNYFAKLKGIKVVSKKYDIQKVQDNIYLNHATINWKWDSIKKPVTARMTFLIKGNCIYLLHSSSMPPFSKKVR